MKAVFDGKTSVLSKEFFYTLTSALEYGAPPHAALEISFASLKLNAKMKQTGAAIIKEVQQGGSFSQALCRIDPSMPGYLSNCISVSEKAGNLLAGLRSVILLTAKRDVFRQKLLGSLGYPVFILMLISVSPWLLFQFNRAFADSITTVAQMYLSLLPSAAAVSLMFLTVYVLRAVSDGQIHNKRAFSTFPFLSALTKSALSLPLAICLQQSAQSQIPLTLLLDSYVSESQRLDASFHQLSRLSKELSRGTPLSDCLENQRVIHPFLLQQSAYYDRTGDFSGAFCKAQDYVTDSWLRSVSAVSTLLPGLSAGYAGASLLFAVLFMYIPFIQKTGGII